MAIATHKMKGRQRFYQCPKCGMDHPSVSTLLDVMASPALMGWMSKNGTSKLNVMDGVLGEVLEPEQYNHVRYLAEQRWKLTEDTAYWKSGKETGQEAADIGSMVHAWVESHLKGVTVDLGALPQSAQNAVGAYLGWEKGHTIKTLETERTFYNCRLNYAGTADWVGELDGELCVADWKTASGVYFTHIIQGWGYALADETENASRLYGQILIGRFGKDGTPDPRVFKRNAFPSIETARDVLTACGAIFGALQEYDRKFPYVKPTKKQEVTHS